MIRVAMIGCGSITQKRHAPEYAENPHCRIAGFYDLNPERAKMMADQYGGKVYLELPSLLTDPEIDAVSVCTPNKYHAEHAIEAMLNGKHVLCEKPMATSLEQASEMIGTAEQTERVLMIGHNQRLAAAHQKARSLIQQGDIGRILTFRTLFCHGGPENWSQDSSRSTWFFRQDDAFLGALGDLGIHKVDLLRWLLAEEFTEVYAQLLTLDKKDASNEPIRVEDHAICVLKTKSGITGTLTASWVNYGLEENSTVLYGSRGVMKIYDHPEYPIEINYASGEQAYHRVRGIQTNQAQTKTGIIDQFIASVMNGQPPEIDGREGAAALRVVLACLESMQKKQAVQIN